MITEEAANPTIAEQCDALWQRITDGRLPKFSSEGKRENKGSYIHGYSNDFWDWTISLGEYTVIARNVRWQQFSFEIDREGTRRFLTVKKGEEAVFHASQEGASSAELFNGADGKYTGGEENPEKEWIVQNGSIPAFPESA